MLNSFRSGITFDRQSYRLLLLPQPTSARAAPAWLKADEQQRRALLVERKTPAIQSTLRMGWISRTVRALLSCGDWRDIAIDMAIARGTSDEA